MHACRSTLEDPTSVTYALDRLEERGLIKRVPSQDSRREVLLELTEEGREVLFSANQLAWNPIVQVSEVIQSDEELDVAFAFLLKLRNRAAELCGASIDALNFALEHRRRDPFLFGPAIESDDESE